MRRFIVVLLFCAYIASADDSRDDRWWRSLTAGNLGTGFRLGYVLGMLNTCGGVEGLCGFEETKANNDEIVELVNAFYANPANRSIPIMWAVRVSILKIDGHSAAEIQRLTERFRELAAKDR